MNPRRKVLVVDDDPIVLEITRDRLEKAGYAVITREQPVGTSSAILKEAPDVLLLDVSMPGLSGEAIARLIRTYPKHKNMAVIFHSARPVEELNALAAECAAAGSIQKTSDDSMFRLQFDRLLVKWRTGNDPDPRAAPPPSSRRKG